MRGAGSRRRGLDPFQSGWAQGVIASHDGPRRRRRARSAGRLQQGTRGNRPGADLRGVRRSGGRVRRLGDQEGSGRAHRPGRSELVLPGPALGQVQGEAAGRAGEPSGQGEEASPQVYQRLAQTDARGPARQVMGDDLDGQPGAVGGEAARGEVVEPHAVLQVADGVLDLGVAAMVGLQIQGVALPAVMKA